MAREQRAVPLKGVSLRLVLFWILLWLKDGEEGEGRTVCTLLVCGKAWTALVAWLAVSVEREKKGMRSECGAQYRAFGFRYGSQRGNPQGHTPRPL